MAGGVLYHPDMGDNVESTIRPRPDGSFHQTVHDKDGGGRYSWDERDDGSNDPHFTDQGYPKGDPCRHPFGR